MENKDKIQEFVKNNKLDFTSTDSGLNSNCVVLAGYACYLGYDDYIDVLNAFDLKESLGWKVNEEFERVFNYAYENNYGDWWTHKEAHTMYEF